jgi:hypothetical protein
MNDEEAVTHRVDGGRLHDGKFAQGNRFARGNPYLKRVHALRAKLVECATDEDLEKIVKKLSELAAGGDVAAARLWLEHCLGKPTQALELSGLDGAPLGGDLGMLRTVVLAALAKHPEARIEVAAALLRLRSTDGPDRDAGD